MQLSLDVSGEYLATPLSSREGAPPLRRHHSTPSWTLQTPTPAHYYYQEMYRELSGSVDGSYPITPASDEDYRSQYVIDSPPHSTGSSPQSSGTVTPEMLRTMPGTLPPSPLSTPDVMGGLTHSCAYPGCSFASGDVEIIRRHALMYHPHQTPKQVAPPSLMIDANGVASISFIKRESPSTAYLHEAVFEDEEEDMMVQLDHTQLYSMTSPYGMTRSNTMPSGTPVRTPTNAPRLYHPYAPVTPASYSRHIRNQHSHSHSHSHSLSDPSLAASLALLPTSTHTTPYLSPPTPPPRGATPHSRSAARSSRPSSSLPLVVSALDKSHVCEICQKRFKRLEHLRRHNKTHTGERGFRCEVTGCGKWFSRSDNLMAHRRYSNLVSFSNFLELMGNVVDGIFLFLNCLLLRPCRPHLFDCIFITIYSTWAMTTC